MFAVMHLLPPFGFVYSVYFKSAIENRLFFAKMWISYEQVRNEKARRYLSSMRKKKPIPFSHKFPNADPLALRLLERMLAFEPKDRPTAEEVCL